jgi:hypothetical protein
MPSHDHPASVAELLSIAAIAALPSIVCLLHLWLRRDAGWKRKSVWTFAVAVPIIGPLFYGSRFRAPEMNPSHGPAHEGSLPRASV